MLPIVFHTFGTESFARKLIGARLSSPYSHTAIQFGDKLYEATMLKGVFVKDNVHRVKSKSSITIYVTEDVYNRVEQLAVSKVGMPYDYQALFSFIVTSETHSEGGLFCSEYGYLLFKEATGLDFKLDSLITPGQLRLLIDAYNLIKA